MKTSFRLLCFLAVAMLTAIPTAEAQRLGFPGGTAFGGGLYEPGSFTPVAGDLNIGVPGRVWLRANYADQGLGYQGGYATLGFKQRLFYDFLGGRWLSEGRFHYGFENEGFFTNVGIERVMSIESANADVTTGIWYTYDGDKYIDEALDFHEVGINASIKTPKWDLIGNGYFPVGTTEFVPSSTCFVGHNITLQPLVDSALEGFDVTLRMKPAKLAFMNGTVDLAGYGYSSSLTDYFGGGRIRVGAQLLNGAMLSAELNYDDRFDLTGVAGVGWTFGANPGTGSNWGGIGRDLESTVRNDHIVRAFSEAVLAIDPDTGLPYNVEHVDNTADAAFADGTFDRPWTTLADAEANSGTDDIIFVNAGNGLATGMRDGIVLQDRQMLLSNGVRHLIPIQDDRLFLLCNDADGNRATIAGSNNGPAVTLASDNVVRGFNIDGDAGVGGMIYGIYGDGFFGPVNNGTIQNNIITNAILDGVFLNDITGDWDIVRNDVNNNGFDGIRIQNACDPNSVFNFIENSVTFNGRDGISMENYDAAEINFIRNVTSNNVRDGVRLIDFKGVAVDRDLALRFQNHTSADNSGFGINIINGQGPLEFINPVITGNAEGGIRVIDWFADITADRDRVVVDGGTILGNVAGAGLHFFNRDGVMDLLVTNTVSNGNGYGLRLQTENPSTLMRAQVIDNIGFNNNLVDGIQAYAISGSTIELLVDQPTAFGRMPILGNGQHGINLLAGDNFPLVDAEIFATIQNTNLTGNTVHGINAQSIQDGFLELDLIDSNVDGNGAFGLNILTANSQLNPRVINTIRLNRVTMLDNGSSSVVLNSGPNTYTDLSIRSSNISYTQAIDATGDNNPTRLAGFGANGVQINVAGDALTAFEDSRTRFELLDTTVSGANFDGLEINTTGDARFLADFTGNLIELNGFIGDSGDQATGAGEIETPPDGTGLGTFFHGIDVNATGPSVVNLRLTANDIDRNSEQGVSMTTGAGSTINSLWTTNDLSVNDTTDDPDTPGPEDNNFDWFVGNGFGGNICLALTNNNDSNGRLLINASAAVDFELELDGLTNGFGPGAVPGNITLLPFGSTCEGRIEAEEAAFGALGFIPLP
ncbi:MAG: right-handed parallel beta-helix repeat-containing protein [Planctomycetota bacterium]